MVKKNTDAKNRKWSRTGGNGAKYVEVLFQSMSVNEDQLVYDVLEINKRRPDWDGLKTFGGWTVIKLVNRC